MYPNYFMKNQNFNEFLFYNEYFVDLEQQREEQNYQELNQFNNTNDFVKYLKNKLKSIIKFILYIKKEHSKYIIDIFEFFLCIIFLITIVHILIVFYNFASEQILDATKKRNYP